MFRSQKRTHGATVNAHRVPLDSDASTAKRSSTLTTKAALLNFHLTEQADDTWVLNRWNLSKLLPDEVAVLNFWPDSGAIVRRAFTEALTRKLWAAAYVAEESRERNAAQRRYVRSATCCLELALFALVGAA